MPAINFSPRDYIASVLRDAWASIGRVVHDRAALVALILLLLPWGSLIFLRDNYNWLEQLGQIAGLVFIFWWMSRSGAAPLPQIKWPRLEFAFAFLLLLLWVGWRTVICAKWLPGLPANFVCYKSWELETLPKLIEQVILPVGILFLSGYGFRSQGLALNLRAWWIALPVLLGAAAYGFYTHQKNPMQFVQDSGEFFLAAGLPEEVLFRAILFTRLEAWWRRSGWALLGASLLFGLSHLPIDYLVFTRRDWRETWIALLTYQVGFGAVFAFAYQRTRNVWPIAVLHALVDAM